MSSSKSYPKRLAIGFLQWAAGGVAAISAYMLQIGTFENWNWFYFCTGALAHVSAGLVALGRFYGAQVDTEKPGPTSKKSVWRFGAASEKHLSQADPDIVRVHRTALRISPVDFAIIESLREVETQRENVRKGVSWTMESRHLERPLAKALDHVPFVDGKEDWSWEAFALSTQALKDAARIEGVPCTHGIDWQGVRRDGAHTELDRKAYPYVRPDILL